MGNVDDGSGSFIPAGIGSVEDRIFAELSAPPGRNPEPILHDKVDLEVRLDRPVVAGKKRTLTLKLFDPDFTSEIFDPGDEFGRIDGTPNDNIGGIGATLASTEITIGGDEVAPQNQMDRTILTIQSRQPTNDYRVAAFASTVKATDFDFSDDGFNIEYQIISALTVAIWSFDCLASCLC